MMIIIDPTLWIYLENDLQMGLTGDPHTQSYFLVFITCYLMYGFRADKDNICQPLI